MTALATALEHPNSEKVFVAELTAGKHQPVWENVWSPYIHSDLKFSVWASDVLGQADGTSLLSVDEKIQGYKFRTLNTAIPTATVKYTAIETNTKRPTFSFDRPAPPPIANGNACRNLRPIDYTKYFSADEYSWFCVVTKDIGSVFEALNYYSGQYHVKRLVVTEDTVYVDHGQQVTHTLGGELSDGLSHILSATRNGDVFKLYVDGVLVDAQTISNATHATIATPGDMTVGYWSGSAQSEKMSGIFLYSDYLADADREAFEEGLKSYYLLGDQGPSALKLYTVEETERVSSVTLNGTPLTAATSVSNCQATSESYYWDGFRVYINSATDPRLTTNTPMILIKYLYSSKQGELDGKFYANRLKSVPDLSLRIEEKFEGIAQVGGGTLVLNNGDHYYHSKMKYHWDAGQAVVKLGCNYSDYVMPYADYETIGRWNIEDWNTNDIDFAITLKEIKARVQKNVPIEVYSIDDYPLIDEGSVGKPIQVAYGTIYGAAPVCIDTSTNTFKLAGHAIKTIFGARTQHNSGWTATPITNIDMVNATFICPDWDGSQLSVDFQGKLSADGTLMDNPSDIVKDLLAYINETDIDADSFAAAKAICDIGYIGGESIQRDTLFKPGFYISDYEKVFDLISELNSFVGSYLYSDAEGFFHYRIFEPVAGDGAVGFKTNEIADWKLNVVTSGGILSYLQVECATRVSESWGVTVLEERTRNQYLRNEKSRLIDDPKVRLSDPYDASYYAQRRLVYEGELSETHSFTLSEGRAFFIKPGNLIHIQYSDLLDSSYLFDEIVEVYSVEPSLVDKPNVKLTVGNLHGFSGMCGFWVADRETLPTRFANLPGYHAGDITWYKDSHRLIKDYKRQNYGYWTDAFGFVDPTDPESYIPSTWF